MAIFVAFAWAIEAAEWLGLIEIECQEAHSRAYRLAHQGVALIKDELAGRVLEVLDEHSVGALTQNGRMLLQSLDGIVVRRQDGGDLEPLLDLGPGGGASFSGRDARTLEVRISARTEDGGAYDVCLALPSSTAKPA